MPQVALWIEQPSNRARYALEHLVGNLIGWDIRWASGRDDLHPEHEPCLVYAEEGLKGALHLRPCGWLVDGADRGISPRMSNMLGVPTLFPVEGGHMRFDPLAGAFFHLARVEEWHGLPADEHGRPLTSAMHAARNNYLHHPVVDQYASFLAEYWRAVDYRLPAQLVRYRHEATIDLDNGFKYLGREAWRSAGAWLRDALQGEWSEVRDRAAVLQGKARDPYELDAEVLEAFDRHATRTIAFVLAADRGPCDHAVAVEHPQYSAYLQGLSARMEMGVHPSYASSVTPGLTLQERDRLAAQLRRPVVLARQHFLRFATPDTFRTAIALGFKEEHSMGCHDRLGFRAGTCSPYRWYDLDREQATDLVIHPFAVMDNTLRNKLRLTPDEAVRAACAIVDSVKIVGGTFSGLWHESFLASRGPNRPWREAILRILRHAAP